ncbi:MAG: general secretion pathway protein GspD [Bacteroidetes bacterium QH_6_63_17]|nr:MAG: general secretion pathway protein GspD [Bacteroidetes bacterium QH_6_63_17]
MTRTLFTVRVVVSSLLAVVVLGGGAIPVEAQERPDRRKMRTDISPDLLVSFGQDAPFNQFIELINPIFERELNKPVVDPRNRSTPIGIPVSGMYFLDAFEQVLEANGLTYRETGTAFLVQEAEEPREAGAVPTDTTEELPATIGTREVRINAILFNLNLSKVRNRGLRWDEILGSTQGGGGQGGGGGGQGGGGQGGGGGGQQGRGGGYAVRTDNLFESVDNILQTPDQISLSQLRRFLNIIEQDQIGRTIANPQITVQSGEQGNIQIGSDVPIQTTDFSGNTITEFVSTGVIIDVVPTLISQPVADTAGAPVVDFVHMDVQVEDSNSQPSDAGTIINRNQAETQILLVDGEATAIGGLISTQKNTSRSGVPILKDLPGWVFGLRYIFGTEQTTVNKRELLIVLRAEVVDPLQARARQKIDDNLLDQRRQQAREALERVGPSDDAAFPDPEEAIEDSLEQSNDGGR